MSEVFVNTLARRYAEAMLEAAGDKRLEDVILRDLGRVKVLLDKVDGLLDTLKNPALPIDRRMDLITKVARVSGFNTLTANLLKLLLQNRRLGLFTAIVTGYTEALDKKRGIVRARVITARPLSMSLAMKLSDALRKHLNAKRVILDKQVDPAVLGGLRVVVGDRVFDMSVQGYLEDLKTKLLGGS